LLLVHLRAAQDPSIDGAKNADGSPFRSDWSVLRAVDDAIDDIEWDGILSSYRDVRSIEHFWLWLDAAVDALYDDDEYQSANAFKYEAHGNVSGWIATHNKQVAHLTIVQERRMPRTCEIDHASLVPLCYDSFDVRKFTPKPLDKFVEIAPFFPPGMNQSELDATGLAHAFVCTDTAGLLCDKSDPLDEFFDGKDLGEKPVSARNTGYKLDVDLGIFRSGLATSKQRIADARALKWLDKETRLVTFSLLLLNGNVDVIAAVDLHFFFDVAGHVRTQRVLNTVRVENMYTWAPRFRAWRAFVEIACAAVGTNWTVVCTATVLVALLRWFLLGRSLWRGEHRCSLCGKCAHSQTLFEALVSGAASCCQAGMILIWWVIRDAIRKLDVPEYSSNLEGCADGTARIVSSATRDDAAVSTCAIQEDIRVLKQKLYDVIDMKEWYSRYFVFVTVLLVANTLMALHKAHPRLSIIGNTLLFAAGDLIAFLVSAVSVNVIFLVFAVSFFGARSAAFKGVILALRSLMRWAMGDFATFDELTEIYAPNDSEINRKVLTVFWLYVATNTVFLQNVLLSIVVESYLKAKEHSEKSSTIVEDIQMSLHFYKCGFRSCIRCAQRRAARREAKLSEGVGGVGAGRLRASLVPNLNPIVSSQKNVQARVFVRAEEVRQIYSFVCSHSFVCSLFFCLLHSFVVRAEQCSADPHGGVEMSGEEESERACAATAYSARRATDSGARSRRASTKPYLSRKTKKGLNLRALKGHLWRQNSRRSHATTSKRAGSRGFSADAGHATSPRGAFAAQVERAAKAERAGRGAEESGGCCKNAVGKMCVPRPFESSRRRATLCTTQWPPCERAHARPHRARLFPSTRGHKRSLSLSLSLSRSRSLALSLSLALRFSVLVYGRVAWAPGALAQWKRSFWRVVTAADVVDALHASLIERDEVRVSQVCRDLERRKVHPWIVDRVGRRLEKLVLGVAATGRNAAGRARSDGVSSPGRRASGPAGRGGDASVAKEIRIATRQLRGVLAEIRAARIELSAARPGGVAAAARGVVGGAALPRGIEEESETDDSY
jgi:hypothetical protein